MSPRSSEIQKVYPSRIVSNRLALSADDPGAARLLQRLDHDLVDVHVQRTGDGEQHAVRDLIGRDRVDALVDRSRLLGVALEANERELGSGDEPGIARRAPEWPGEAVTTQA